jgi:hypothetical protein
VRCETSSPQDQLCVHGRDAVVPRLAKAEKVEISRIAFSAAKAAIAAEP